MLGRRWGVLFQAPGIPIKAPHSVVMLLSLPHRVYQVGEAAMPACTAARWHRGFPAVSDRPAYYRFRSQRLDS